MRRFGVGKCLRAEQKIRSRNFTALQSWPWSQRATIIAKDINCVQSTTLDRIDGKRTGRPESAALQTLVESAHLVALAFSVRTSTSTGRNMTLSIFSHTGFRMRRVGPIVFTCLKTGCWWYDGFRSMNCKSIRTINGCGCTSTTRPLLTLPGGSTVTYPIRSAQPVRVVAELLVILIEEEVGHGAATSTWDDTAGACLKRIKRLNKSVRQRRNSVVHRVQVQSRAHILTRKALKDVTVEEARKKYSVRVGNRLERTMDQLRRNFNRVSIFEKDQTITTIRHINGAAFTRTMTTADRCASEW